MSVVKFAQLAIALFEIKLTFRHASCYHCKRHVGMQHFVTEKNSFTFMLFLLIKNLTLDIRELDKLVIIFEGKSEGFGFSFLLRYFRMQQHCIK